MLNNIVQQTSVSQQRQRTKKATAEGIEVAAKKGPAEANKSQHAHDVNAYWVEVTLDNSNHRIPFAAKEIVLRKLYNCDTDREDYTING